MKIRFFLIPSAYSAPLRFVFTVESLTPGAAGDMFSLTGFDGDE